MFVELNDFEFGCEPLQAEYYREGAQDLIRKIVPNDILDAPINDQLSARIRFNDMLPLLKTSDLTNAPCNFSVILLCKYRQNVCHFFYEMISRWLLSHQRMNVELFFASDVRLPRLSEDLLSVAEIVVQIKSVQDLEEVRRNLKQIETEIRLGAISHYHAKRVLEFKGLSGDGKIAMIQEKISSLIQSRSKDFDRGIFSQMQHFLVNCREEFKNRRDYHHISRIISNLYSLRKLLMQNTSVLPTKRHFILKFLKTRLMPLQQQEQNHPVLGVLAGLNFLSEHEIFEKRHLIAAISTFIPNIRAIEGSFFVDRARDSSIQTNYVEIEKTDGSDFSHEEIQNLRMHLPDHLETHVEQLTHPIFMPRNEEEVLRNIMSLSRQLRFVTDIPQVIISFDEQQGNELCFTVILIRVIALNQPPIAELFETAHSPLKIIPDRIRKLGSLGRKHIKEATVFRAQVNNRAFLRSDQSVDLYKARNTVLTEISHVLGEIRDFNGGMIGKQNEVLCALKDRLGHTAEQHALLLEKFFFALTPVELRSVMDVEHLKQLFLMMLQSQKSDLNFRKKNSDWLFRQEEKRVFVVLPHTTDLFLKEKMGMALEDLGLQPYQLISFSLDQCSGFLLQSDDPAEQKHFLEAISLNAQTT